MADDDDSSSSSSEEESVIATSTTATWSNIHPPDLYLLVVAHPDDESMFFSPTVRSLLSSSPRWSSSSKAPPPPKLCVLSLSNGGYDGLGQVRSVEMRRAARALGLLRGGDDDDDGGDDGGGGTEEASAVTVLDDDRMRDGPDEVWDEAVVADAVRSEVRKLLLRGGGASANSSVVAKESRGGGPEKRGGSYCSGGENGVEEARGKGRRRHPRRKRRRSAVVLTFDAGGVSGHPNHVSTHRGVRHLLETHRSRRRRRLQHSSSDDVAPKEASGESGGVSGAERSDCDDVYDDDDDDDDDDFSLCGYELVTIRNPLVKYFPFFDLLLLLAAFLFRLVLYLLGLTTTLDAGDPTPPPPVIAVASGEVPVGKSDESKTTTVTTRIKTAAEADGATTTTSLTYRTFEPYVVWSAMAAHVSQFVWYRRLSVLFSRYTYWNELRPIAVFDAADVGSSHVEEKGDTEEEEAEVPPDVVIAEESGADGKHESPPPILSLDQMRRIAAKVLPPTARLKRWTRLYSLARDGDAFASFLTKTKKGARQRGPYLLVVETTKGEVLGSCTDNGWEPQGGGFYGEGTACLWRIRTTTTKKEGGDDDETAVDVFRWSGLNRCVQLCDPSKKILALGGGGKDGAFGLCLSDDFRRGTTGRCETFRNEPLLCEVGAEDGGGGTTFDVLNVECWGFLSG